MIQECVFNTARDKDIVRSGLAIDLNTAIDTGVIRSTGVDTEYQGGEDYSLDSVGKRFDDPFAAMDAQRKLFKSAKNKAAKAAKGETVKPQGGEAD